MVRGKPAAHTTTINVSAVGEMERGKEKGVGRGRRTRKVRVRKGVVGCAG